MITYEAAESSDVEAKRKVESASKALIGQRDSNSVFSFSHSADLFYPVDNGIVVVQIVYQLVSFAWLDLE